MPSNYKLHDLPNEDRPRERLQQVGADNLSQQELLALIIEKGRSGRNVLQLAQRLLFEFGSLAKLKQASLKELQSINGIGPATACKLKAAFCLGEKANNSSQVNGKKIINAEQVFEYLKSKFGTAKKEHFVLLTIDSRRCLIAQHIISIGTLNASLVHPREVFKPAIKDSAAGIVLAHNHPSGDLKPSHNDDQVTNKINQASKMMKIDLIDHLIITNQDYFSYREAQLI
jgi:DNA repair protein RadC